MSNISYGGQLAILRLKRWCKWYLSLNGGKIPQWLTNFTDEEFFDGFQYKEQDQSIDSKSHCSANTTKTTSDADVNLRVKLSKFPTFTYKIKDWYNFYMYFYAVADAAGLV